MAVDTRYVTHDQWTGYTATDLTYPSTRQVTSGYDALYRRNSIAETSGGTSIAAWQFFGQRTATVTLGNGMVTSHMNNAQSRSAIQYGQTTPAWGDITTDQLGYDGAGRLIGKRHFNASTGVLVGNTTSYDPSSNKLFERALHAESRSFLYDSYDSMDRLLDNQRGILASGGGSVTTPISLPGTNQEQSYNLDALGNWSTTTITPEGGTASTQTRTHNLLNEVTQYGVYPAMTSVLYDQGNNSGTPPQKGNGNIINDGVRLYKYDAMNRLIQVNSAASPSTVWANYTYDALGRRTRKAVSNGGITGTIANSTYRYTYNGQQIVEELDGSNNTTRQFVWGQYIDELIQLKIFASTLPLPTGSYCLLSDLLYRSVALTNASGGIVEAYDTDAYGNTLIFSAGGGTGGAWFSNADTVSVQPACETIFTGRQYDPETQIYFYRARYYQPMLGRFIGRDPLVAMMLEFAFRLGELNIYQAFRSNAMTLVDPFGEQSIPAAVAEAILTGDIATLQTLLASGMATAADLAAGYVVASAIAGAAIETKDEATAMKPDPNSTPLGWCTKALLSPKQLCACYKAAAATVAALTAPTAKAGYIPKYGYAVGFGLASAIAGYAAAQAKSVANLNALAAAVCTCWYKPWTWFR